MRILSTALLLCCTGLAAANDGWHLILQSSDPVEAIAWSDEGASLALSSLRGVRVYDAGSGAELASFRSPRCLIHRVSFRGGLLGVGAQDCYPVEPGGPGVLRFWNSAGELQRLLRYHQARLPAIAMSADGQRAAAVALNGEFRLWDAASGELLQRRNLSPAEQRNFISAWAISANLNVVALRDWRERYMLLYDAASGQLLQRSEYPYLDDQPLFQFAPDSQSYFDGARWRRLSDGSALLTLPLEDGLAATRAAFSEDAGILAVASAELAAPAAQRISPDRLRHFRIRLYRAGSSAAVAEWPVELMLRSLAFSPDGQRLCAGGFDGRLLCRSLGP
ncbi:MAG: hypothetical protein K1X75_06860 [Leptospirales bacterium]|nr:hypothetical protein [Leptospirales bacterium]